MLIINDILIKYSRAKKRVQGLMGKDTVIKTLYLMLFFTSYK